MTTKTLRKTSQIQKTCIQPKNLLFMLKKFNMRCGQYFDLRNSKKNIQINLDWI